MPFWQSANVAHGNVAVCQCGRIAGKSQGIMPLWQCAFKPGAHGSSLLACPPPLDPRPLRRAEAQVPSCDGPLLKFGLKIEITVCI